MVVFKYRVLSRLHCLRPLCTAESSLVILEIRAAYIIVLFYQNVASLGAWVLRLRDTQSIVGTNQVSLRYVCWSLLEFGIIIS